MLAAGEHFHISVNWKWPMLFVAATAEGAEHDRFRFRSAPLNVAADTGWKGGAYVMYVNVLFVCVYVCVYTHTDSPDISIMVSVLIKRPGRGVWGLITVMKLITLAMSAQFAPATVFSNEEGDIIQKIRPGNMNPLHFYVAISVRQ